MRILLLFLFSGMMIGILSPATSYGWEFGGFVSGDVFEYSICDEYTFDANTSLYSKCYDLKLRVIDNFEMDFGNVWLLYVEVMDDGELIHDIIIVDESFRVNSLNHRYIQDSIENTLFWMPTHASMNEIKLELGNVVSNISGTYDNAVVTDFSREFESMQYVVSFDSGGTIIIREDLHLPISISMDTEISSFVVQLNSMYNDLEFGSVQIGDIDSNYSAIIPNILHNDTDTVSENDGDIDFAYSDAVKSDGLYSDVFEDNSNYSAIIPNILHNDTGIVSKNNVQENNYDQTIEIPIDDSGDDSGDDLFVPEIDVVDLNNISENDVDLFEWLNGIVSSFFESLF
jgi:hypothetical protein